MSSQTIRKATLGVKETGESGLFTIFSNRAWLQAFNASAFHFILMPIMGLTFLINMAIDWYQLKKAANKNYLLWLSVFASTLSALAANTAIWGTLTADILGTSFAAGPWFFIVALSIGLAMNSLMFALNLYQAFKAPKGSGERVAYLQSAVNSVFNMLILGAIMATVSVALISPAGPLITMAIALTAVALTLANLSWRLMPHDWKLAIKGVFGFAKPDNDLTSELTVKPTVKLTETIKPKVVSSLFSQGYRSLDVKKFLASDDLENALNYLKDTIALKSITLSTTNDSKSIHKRAILSKMQQYLEAPQENYLPSKSEVLIAHSKAFQSRLRTKGDIEDIYDAVNLYKSHFDSPQASNQLSFK
jgi:hypothetical protein